MDAVFEILLDLAPLAEIVAKVASKDPFLAADLVAAAARDADCAPDVYRPIITALVERLETQSHREVAIEAFAKLGVAGVEALRSLLTHRHKWVRRAWVERIGKDKTSRGAESAASGVGRCRPLGTTRCGRRAAISGC